MGMDMDMNMGRGMGMDTGMGIGIGHDTDTDSEVAATTAAMMSAVLFVILAVFVFNSFDDSIHKTDWHGLVPVCTAN